jgi:hypothetical protein
MTTFFLAAAAALLVAATASLARMQRALADMAEALEQQEVAQ